MAVTAAVVVVRLEDSNHIPARCLLQPNACCVLDVLNEKGGGGIACKNRIPLKVKRPEQQPRLLRFLHSSHVRDRMPVAVGSLLRLCHVHTRAHTHTQCMHVCI